MKTKTQARTKATAGRGVSFGRFQLKANGTWEGTIGAAHARLVPSSRNRTLATLVLKAARPSATAGGR